MTVKTRDDEKTLAGVKIVSVVLRKADTSNRKRPLISPPTFGQTGLLVTWAFNRKSSERDKVEESSHERLRDERCKAISRLKIKKISSLEIWWLLRHPHILPWELCIPTSRSKSLPTLSMFSWISAPEDQEGPLPVKFHFFLTEFSCMLPCACDSQLRY